MFKTLFFLVALALVRADVVEEDSCEYLDNGCPADFNIHLLLPHETSCRKFYYCANGEKILTKCGVGSVFNPDTQNCDRPGSIDRVCEEEESSEESTQEDSQSSEEIERLPNGCPVDWGYSTYLPHEYYCNKYYQCNFGILVERRCAPGTHFNPQTQNCDFISVVGCTLPGGDADSSEELTTEAPVTTTRAPFDVLDNGCPVDGSINWLVPHENDCSQFYFCVWGGLIASNCPAGLHFSVALQRCESPAVAGCICQSKDCSEESNSSGSENDDESNNVSASVEDNNVSEPADSDNVSDVAVNSSSEEDLPIGNDPVGSGSSSSEEDLPVGNDPVESSEEQNDVTGNKCEDECNALPWAHGDCDKYWKCNGKTPELVVCSEGLHFNPNTHTCDFACNVGCVRENVQTTSSQEGVRIYLPWSQIDNKTKEIIKLLVH